MALALVEIGVVTPIQGYVITGARQQCAKSRQGGFSNHLAPPKRTATDRTDGPDAGFPSPRGRSRLAESSLSLRLTKEETSCDFGSIFRVRRCNKKQSSQRGVDRRWHGRPRCACRVGDRLSVLSLDPRFFIYSFAVRVLGLSSRFARLAFVSANLSVAEFLCVLRDLERVLSFIIRESFIFV